MNRIKEEEKKDRLAICKEKKKRYGTKYKNMSKEESKKLKTRTEERIEISQAKANYWKRFRDGGERDMEEGDHMEAWKGLRKAIVALE